MRNVSGEYMIRNGDPLKLKSGGHVQYSDIDHYNRYLSMTQGGPGSIRSSASSNTTLSTVAPDPLGRDRSVSFGTTPNMSPINMHAGMAPHPQTHGMIGPNGSIISHAPLQANMDGVSFYEVHRKLQRPVSLYSTGHVYEEIKEKIPFSPMGQQHVINSQGILVATQGIPQQGQLATTPVYTNVVEDHDGYLIPNKSNKIVNTPTGDEDPSQYLMMTRDMQESEQKRLSKMQYQPQNVHIHNMNNLSIHQAPTTHVQLFDAVKHHHSNVACGQVINDSNRRRSNDSQLSVEQNYTSENLNQNQPPSLTSTPTKETRDPNLNTTSPMKHQSHKTPSTTPNARRQRMPLPNKPVTTTCTSSTPLAEQPVMQVSGSKSQVNLQLPTTTKSGLDSNSSLHQHTSSLPDTSLVNGKISHVKSPSLIPTAENYNNNSLNVWIF